MVSSVRQNGCLEVATAITTRKKKQQWRGKRRCAQSSTQFQGDSKYSFAVILCWEYHFLHSLQRSWRLIHMTMNFIFGCHSSSSPSHDVSTTKNRHRMHGRNIKAMRSIGKNDKQVNATCIACCCLVEQHSNNVKRRDWTQSLCFGGRRCHWSTCKNKAFYLHVPWKAATTMQASPETMKQVVQEQNLFLVSQSMVFEVGCTPVQTTLTEGVMKSYCTSAWAKGRENQNEAP